MKKTVCLLIFFFTLGVRAQEVYRVVKVVGNVENGRLGREIKTGDKIESKDALRFTSPASYLIIISPKTGRKVIHSVPDNAPREIFQLLQSFVKPEERSTATRSTALTYLDELGNTLSYHTVLILGDGKISVNTRELSLNRPAVIMSHYRKGTEWVFRKISDDKAFYLGKSSLFDTGAQPPFHRVALEYYSNENEDPRVNPGVPIAAFVPLFVDDNAFRSEVEVIVHGLGDEPAKTILKEVKSYILSEYGGVQDQNLNNWLQQNQFIKE